MWYVYLLYNPKTNRTYIGSTTNVQRRLRQHNGHIVGGARSTRAGAPNWTLHYHISGFENRSVACRWEKIIKSRAPRGLDLRATTFALVANGICPTKYKKQKLYTVPNGLELHYHE